MKYVKPRPAPLLFMLFSIGGMAIGFSLPWLKEFARDRVGRAGLAVAFVINVAMPVWIVAISAWYPRHWVTVAGAFLASVAFYGALGFSLPAATTHWLSDLIRDLGPIPTIATLGYLGLAAGTSWVVGKFRRVGAMSDPAACPNCSYLLIGSNRDRCPECGSQNIDHPATK